MQKLEPQDISTLDSPTLSTDIQFTTNIELDHTTGSVEELAPYPYRPTVDKYDKGPQSFFSLGRRGHWAGNSPTNRRVLRGTGGVRSRLETLRRGRFSFAPTTASSENEEFELSDTSASGSTSGLGSSTRAGWDTSNPSASGGPLGIP